MKIKLIILIIISSIITYIIYNRNYVRHVNITSINSLNKESNYNKHISNLLSKSNINYNFNIDYTNDTMEIENLIAKINNNENQIQSIIHESDVIIISIGNIDIITEDKRTIYDELINLFKTLRKYNIKEIIYVSPSEFKITSDIKQICHRYNVIFVNGHSFKNKPHLLAQYIISKIESVYNKEKY